MSISFETGEQPLFFDKDEIRVNNQMKDGGIKVANQGGYGIFVAVYNNEGVYCVIRSSGAGYSSTQDWEKCVYQTSDSG